MLNFQQQRFVAEYVKDCNATQAYRRAGYGARRPHYAVAIMKNPEVLAAIDARRVELAQQFDVTEERVRAEFAKLAFANMDDFVEEQEDGSVRIVLANADRARRAALTRVIIEETETKIGGVTKRRMKIQIASKQLALDSLARCLGMYVDRSQINVTTNLGADLDAAAKRAWG